MHTFIRHLGRLGFLLTLTAATQVHAIDGVVGPDNCDEAGFVSVLSAVDGSGGGSITFDCGGAPATIAFSSYKEIANAVSIDGADLIIFDGGGTSAFFQVFASAHVTLKRLTVQHGAFNASHALENFGVLTLDGVSILDNNSSGSAIANYGTLTIQSSIAARNALSGGVNSAGGALFNDGGDAVIVQSTFSNNSVEAGVSGNGGAIAMASGTLTLSGSTFDTNTALDGGAIYIGQASGAVRIDDSVFTGNAAGYGAAIETWGADVQIAGSSFDGNQAQIGDGGAIWSLAGQLVVNFSQFTNNSALTTGGAISCYGDIMNVTNSTFASNQAGSDGGGIYSSCAFSTLNVTFNQNTAPGGGGGAIFQNGDLDAAVTFATIDENSALFGGGIYNEGSSAGILHIGNSIVSANPGGNCDGVLASNGYNLSNDTGCGGSFTEPGDVLNASLPLEPLGNYGGPTSTQPPQAGNPAIDHVPLASCGFSSDQRGAPRPTGAGCDSGAVEVEGIIDPVFTNGFDPS